MQRFGSILAILILSSCLLVPTASRPTSSLFLAPGELTISMEDGVLISATVQGTGQSLVILAYGAGGSQAAWEPLTTEIVKQGQTVLTFDYRGMGKSGGQMGNLAGDMATLIRYLRAHGYPRLACLGHSMGGGACLLAAHEAGMAGLVLINSVTPKEFDRTLKVRYDDLTYPKIIFVSENEGLWASNQFIYDQSPQPKQLFVYPGSSHNLLHSSYRQEIHQKILEFISGL